MMVHPLVLAATLALAPPPTTWWADDLGLAAAWQVSAGEGVVVGLVDSGVDGGHPELAGRTTPGAAFPAGDDGTTDHLGHGTRMARLIGAVAPRTQIMPVRLTGGAADAAEAIRWAVDNGAQVINLSLGGGPGEGERPYDEALRFAAANDVVVVAAAGNAGVDSGVVSPANRPGVLAVSAVDRAGVFAVDVSVSGPEVDLAAPGADVALSGEPPESGTSDAAALVTGTVALVRARYPGLSAPDVIDLLTSTARDRGEPGHDPRYGHGVVDPVAALAAGPSTPSWLWPSVAGWSALLAATGAWWVWRRRRRT